MIIITNKQGINDDDAAASMGGWECTLLWRGLIQKTRVWCSSGQHHVRHRINHHPHSSHSFIRPPYFPPSISPLLLARLLSFSHFSIPIPIIHLPFHLLLRYPVFSFLTFYVRECTYFVFIIILFAYFFHLAFIHSNVCVLFVINSSNLLISKT